MSENKTYTIHPDYWNYNGLNPVFMDDSSGIVVELCRENNGVKLLGSSTSVIDRENIYYYDLTCNSFANRAWNNIFGDYDDIFNNDGEVIIDINVPEWFLNHARKMLDIDNDCIYIFEKAFENYDGSYTLDDIRKTVYDYINNNDIEDAVTDNILYVAEESGMLKYDYINHEYMILI